MATFSERIKQLRMSRGWSQTDLAKKIGIAPQNVQKWESKDVKPRSQTLNALSKLFDKSINWLIGLPDEEETYRDKSDVAEKNTILELIFDRYVINDPLFLDRLQTEPSPLASDVCVTYNQINNLTMLKNRISRSIVQAEILLVHVLTGFLEQVLIKKHGDESTKQTIDNFAYDLMVNNVPIKIVYKNFSGDKTCSLAEYTQRNMYFAIPYLNDLTLPFFMVPGNVLKDVKKIMCENIEESDGRFFLNGYIDITPYFSNYELLE